MCHSTSVAQEKLKIITEISLVFPGRAAQGPLAAPCIECRFATWPQHGLEPWRTRWLVQQAALGVAEVKHSTTGRRNRGVLPREAVGDYSAAAAVAAAAAAASQNALQCSAQTLLL